MKKIILILAGLFLIAGFADAQQSVPIKIAKWKDGVAKAKQSLHYTILGTVGNNKIDTTVNVRFRGVWAPPDTLFGYVFTTDADSGNFAIKGRFGHNRVMGTTAFTDSGHWTGGAGAVMAAMSADSCPMGQPLYYRKPAYADEIQFIIGFVNGGNSVDNDDTGNLNPYYYQIALIVGKNRLSDLRQFTPAERYERSRQVWQTARDWLMAAAFDPHINQGG